MRWRITLRSDPPQQVELRGFLDVEPDEWEDRIAALAEALEPLGILVIGSPTDADYNPFNFWDQPRTVLEIQNIATPTERNSSGLSLCAHCGRTVAYVPDIKTTDIPHCDHVDNHREACRG